MSSAPTESNLPNNTGTYWTPTPGVFCMRSRIAGRPFSAVMLTLVTSADIGSSPTTLALWGVFSNGEFGPGIDAGWAFSTGLGGRRLTINSGASATLMRPFMANAQQGEPMLEKYFSAPKTLRRLRGGISGPHIDAFADDLEREGYAPSSAVRYIRAAVSSRLLRSAERRCSEGHRSRPCLIPFAAIFGVADALISSAERLAITPSSE